MRTSFLGLCQFKQFEANIPGNKKVQKKGDSSGLAMVVLLLNQDLIIYA